MYKNYLITLLIIIIFLFIILHIINYNRAIIFQNNFKNIYKDDILKNKTIFIIANNPNLSVKSKRFLDNYEYNNNTLVIRFNGYKPIVKDYCKGITDIMYYRKVHLPEFNIATKYFPGLELEDYKNSNIIVFSSEHESIYDFDPTTILKKYDFSNQSIYKNKIKNPKKLLKKNFNCKWGFTSGFSVIYELFKKKIYKKMYLVGFTFQQNNTYTLSNHGHNFNMEKYYFEHTIKKNKNIKLLL